MRTRTTCRHRRFVIALVFCAFALAVNRLAATDVDLDSTPEADARILSTLRLAAVDGNNDEASQVANAAARANELATREVENDSGLAHAGRLLDAANAALAFELEPFCTRKLLGLDSPTGVKPDAIAEALGRTRLWLSAAEELIRTARDADGTLPPDWNGVSRRMAVLSAFAEAQRAFLLPDDGNDAASDRRHVTSLLSPALEDDDPAIAAAASLWLSCIRSDEEQAGTVLGTFELPLAEPQKGTLPFAFFSRLMKCRLLAFRGHPATAVSLLQQLEDRSLDWFTNDSDRAAAERAAALMRWRVLRAWHDRFDARADDTERQWCVNAQKRIQQELFEKGEMTVLRLRPAVPILGRNDEGNAPHSPR